MLSTLWNALVLALTPVFLQLYALESQTAELVIWLVVIHNVFNAVVFPYSGALGNGLRASGDVKFTMVVAIASAIGIWFLFSYLFGVVLHMGVIGIAIAMSTGDQPQAIAELVKGFKEGNQFQTLLGGCGFRQDVHNGKCHSGIAEPHSRYST